jgi:hypothetical protein
VLRHNAKADQFPVLGDDGNNIDEEFRDFMLEIVTRRYPEISADLKQKLAYGLVLRRKRFLYRRNHQQKLRTRTVTTLKVDTTTPDDNRAFVETDSTVRGQRVVFESPVQEFANWDDNGPARPALSQTSVSGEVRTALGTRDSFDHDEESNQSLSTAFTSTPTSSGPVAIPSPPKPVPGSKEFECPYCCIVLPMSNVKASKWRYVFAFYLAAECLTSVQASYDAGSGAVCLCL